MTKWIFEYPYGTMGNMIKELFEKYKDIIPYAIFGILTTLVNIGLYWACAHVFALSVLPSTILAWIASVLFAYFTNRKWVFYSEARGARAIIKEMIYFFGCRIATGVIDWICMFAFVDILHLNDLLIKTLSNILVIILNYLASKMIIFKKEQ